ncbi:MAG: GSCFA domain-containing protein [Chitinophagales bacterium]
MLDIQIPSPKKKINYRDPVMLMGSCFTEHIGEYFGDLKFTILQNPNGILFDPFSVSNSIKSYISGKIFQEDSLFPLNGLWHSWQHHSAFDHSDQHSAIQLINESQQRAQQFLKNAKWLIITLGTAFSYRLTDQVPFAQRTGSGSVASEVANCHRAPAQWFKKHLMSIEEIQEVMEQSLDQVHRFNPLIRTIFTVSPVRHSRDGIVENNRSKARLLEVVHRLVEKYDETYYFPAYELVIDVLRDYRFYDIDMVHPNYQATDYVLEKFCANFVDQESNAIMNEIRKIILAKKHRPFFPETEPHQQFMKNFLERTFELKSKYSFLDFEEEITYFSFNKE